MSATLGATPTIVLVGHGMVGQRFLEALAERGLTATHRVVVLCEEPRPAYDRVALTSYFAGKSPEDLSMTDMEFIETHGIELLVGDPAETIDREAKKVTARSGQVFEYAELTSEGMTLSADSYGSIFYLATGFHGLHVTGGLIAFLLIIGRTFTTRRYTHAQATGAVVTSYYWHFVDVVWIALFLMIYVLK